MFGESLENLKLHLLKNTLKLHKISIQFHYGWRKFLKYTTQILKYAICNFILSDSIMLGGNVSHCSKIYSQFRRTLACRPTLIETNHPCRSHTLLKYNHIYHRFKTGCTE